MTSSTKTEPTSPADLRPARAASPGGPTALLGRLAGSSPRGLDVGLLLLRVGFGTALAFGHGLGKLTASGGFLEGLSARGFPAPVLLGWAAILSEFAGGLLLAVGLLTRPAAALVFITLSVAAFGAHAADPFAKRELALAYALVAAALLASGPGRYSLDRRLFGHES